MRTARYPCQERLVNQRRSFPRLLFATAFVVPLLLLGFGAILTTFYHVAACPLCIVQRLLYLMVSLAALGGLIWYRSRQLTIASAIAVFAVSAGGAGVAGYQKYLQLHPFTATCGDGSSWWERLVAWLGNLLPILFKAEGLCSDDTWSLFGLSIVDWSLAAFVGLALLAVLALLFRQIRT